MPIDLGGGSGVTKALVFAELIERFDVREAIEIGVYRGRSLLPIAAMFRMRGTGRVTGIDPWSADAALQHDAHEVGDVVNDWARAHPWDDTYAQLVERIETLELSDHCTLLRMTSADAAPLIPDASVGLVHIDGNHDRAAVELDVSLFLPKLRPGGFLALDDASWNSVRPVLEELRSQFELVFQVYGKVPVQDEQLNDFAVFRVPGGG